MECRGMMNKRTRNGKGEGLGKVTWKGRAYTVNKQKMSNRGEIE